MITRYGHGRSSRALPILLALIVTLAGCSGSAPQVPPPGEAPIPPSAAVPPPATSLTVALFYSDWQAQHLIPEVRQVPQAAGAELATRVVRELLAGPDDPHLQEPFPAGVTLLEPVTIEDGTALVNLSKEIRSLEGSAAVMAALTALRLSLTEIEGIQRVQVLIDGQSDAELGGLMLEPMDRGLYPYPVFVNPERVRYLQTRHGQGLEPWRADPLKVAQWEGRMFGFTQADLQGAKVVQQGAVATAQVTRSGSVYTFTLAQNQVAAGEGIWTIQALDPLIRHTISSLPAPLQTWADRYASTTVGVSRHEGDRTYLMAVVEEGAVQIDSVDVKDGQLVVYVEEQGAEQVSLASVSGVDTRLPVTFRWKSEPVGRVSRHTAPDTLPAVYNPHRLPETKLAADIVVLTPVADQAVSGAITIKGYARHLFEANLAARLLNQQGDEVAGAFTTAGACCFDWGSFDFVLEHDAPAGNYRLELGNHSPRDGEWQPRMAIAVSVAG